MDDCSLNIFFSMGKGAKQECIIGRLDRSQEHVPADLAMALSVDGCYYIDDQRLANSYDKNGNVVYSQNLEKCRKDCRDNIHKLKLFVDDKLSPFYRSPFKADADRTEDYLALYDNLVKWGLLNAKRRESILPDSDEYQNVVTTISVLYQEIAHDKWMHEMYLGLQNLLDILGSYQYDNKTIELSLEHGFRFKTTGKHILRLNQLSSGEQHILLQVYELLFNAPEGSLVLVDEPETSQHLAWQMEYCSNMEKISNARHLQCLIATHLPQMFDNDFSRTVDLYTLAHPEEY